MNRQASQLYLKRLSGAHPELAKQTNGFDEKYLRRISKLPAMTKMKINFCNGLLGNKSPIVHALGDAVNCKEVFSRFGKDRNFRTKGHQVSEVSNYIEDDTNNIVNDGWDNADNENIYIAEEPWSSKDANIPPEKPFISDTVNFDVEPQDLVPFNGGKEDEFQPIPTQITNDYTKNVPLAETTFSVISNDPQIPGNAEPTPMKQFLGSEIFEKVPSSSENPPPDLWKSSSPDPNPTSWPETTTLNSYFTTDYKTKKPQEWTTTESQVVTTSRPTAPALKGWHDKSQNNYNHWDLDNWPVHNRGEDSETWISKDTNDASRYWTTNVPQPKPKQWTTDHPKIEHKQWTTEHPKIKHKQWTTEHPKIEHKQWTTEATRLKEKFWTTRATKVEVMPWTTESPKLVVKHWITEEPKVKVKNWSTLGPKYTKPTSHSNIWTTFSPKKIVTKKSVLPAPSDPTQPLFGNFEVTSNPWPSQFGSELLENVGKNFKDIQERGAKTEILKEENSHTNPTTTGSYFNLENKPALEFETHVDLPNFNKQSFTSFGNFESNQESVYAKYENGKNTKSFFSKNEKRRPKKEVNKSVQDTYFSINTDTEGSKDIYQEPKKSLAEIQAEAIQKGSEEFRSSIFSDTPEIIELYLPDALAPGHPMGNGNHGWAPIEEWAEIQRAEFDNPSWANSEIIPDNLAHSPTQNWQQEAQPKFNNIQSSENWGKREIKSVIETRENSNNVPENTRHEKVNIKTNLSPKVHQMEEESKKKEVTKGPQIMSTHEQATETVVKSLLKPKTYPVTPRYPSPFGNFASLDLTHLSGPTGPPGIAMFGTDPPIKTAQQLQLGSQLNSNSHYMKQNPFIASKLTTTSAPTEKRNVDQSEFWSYNPVTESSVVKSYNPFHRQTWESAPLRNGKAIDLGPDLESTTLKPTSATSSAHITGYSYKNVHFPNSGVNSGYDSFHYKTS